MDVSEVKTMANSVYSLSVDSIRMALALTVALAWHVAVKQVIAKFWVAGNGVWAHILYAIVMTVIFIAVSVFANKVLGLADTSRQVVYAVTP